MGEIADALRRSGLGRSSADAGPGSRTTADPVGSHRPEPRVDVRHAPAAQPTETQLLRPVDPAVVANDCPQLEACRQLALRLRALLRQQEARSVAIVSALRDEGKTTCSCNLAIALASVGQGRRVALLGLDLRRPSLAHSLGLRVSVGIDRVLSGEASVDQARISLEEPALDVFASLSPQRAAHELLARGELSALISTLESHYDLVIVDTPPVLLVPDARLILERVPYCVPVARAGRTRLRSFRDMLDALPRGQVLSTLLNGAPRSGHYELGYEYALEEAEGGAAAAGPNRGGGGG